ncbi:hypothetical protein ACF3MZ_10090 [Paenibacillaceae bacterium WGS1546]|uniref:hypothetical protein n=1 Tax=Cohnella sp. WGS1546 TaxID=3366810 RepID=UPI00372D86B1
MSAAIRLQRLASNEEARLLDERFAAHFPWYRTGVYYDKCLDENRSGGRVTLIAFYDGELAGCCHLLLESDYPYFRENGIRRSTI